MAQCQLPVDVVSCTDCIKSLLKHLNSSQYYCTNMISKIYNHETKKISDGIFSILNIYCIY